MTTEVLLQERGSSHGDFREQFKVAQKLKEVCFDQWGYFDIDPVLREAIEMDLMKLSRILTGQPLFEDHWADRVGYLSLALKRVQELNKLNKE